MYKYKYILKNLKSIFKHTQLNIKIQCDISSWAKHLHELVSDRQEQTGCEKNKKIKKIWE